MESVQEKQDKASNSRKAKRMLRVRHVADELDICVSSVWRLSKIDADFPRPFKLSPRVTVWSADELDAYLIRKAGARKTQVAA